MMATWQLWIRMDLLYRKVEGLTNFEAFSISPSGNKIYFTRRVKLDQTANEKYNLPKARVRIIDDLMYRHWNTGAIIHTAIFLLQILMGKMFQVKRI